MSVSISFPLPLRPVEFPIHRKSYARIAEALPFPNLVRVQIDSFRWFVEEGPKELFAEISPIQASGARGMELHFLDYSFDKPSYSVEECRERDMTYAAPLRVRARLVAKETGEIKEQDIFMGDFPIMTDNGTFIINGAERVVVSQLVRSPGVYFSLEDDATTGRSLCYAKLIPNRGAWLEFETSNKDVLSVKVDRKRKIPVTTLLRAIGYGTDEQIIELFAGATGNDHHYIQETIDKDPAKSTEEALLEFYRRLRPGDPPNLDNSRSLVNSLFFNFRRYDLGKVGRHRLNKRLGLSVPPTTRILTREDLVKIVETMIRLNQGEGQPDDIDHLGNRRVRAVGELIQNAFRVGLLRMERIVKERMSIQDPESATPAALINIRPVVAAMKEFFGGSQLAQFMDQTNPLTELTHKRRLSALGPGGLNRERAGMEVRDVHHSHYGRICPIETPEGPNIGLIGSLACYARINDYGFIETPYRRVHNAVGTSPEQLFGRVLREEIVDPASGEVIASAGQQVTEGLAQRIATLPLARVKVKPFVSSDEIVYLSADEEDRYRIAQANSRLDTNNQFVDERLDARYNQQFVVVSPNDIQFMDVSPKQIVSVATALIPFLEHDDANRALMGSNMQRQAVPLIRPEAPLVGTGVELQAARDSGQVVISATDGVVSRVTSSEVVVLDAEWKRHSYPLQKFVRSNQSTCISQRPIVSLGQKVAVGQPLADGSSTDGGELALGQNVLVAFMFWEGYNFEDAIIISGSITRDDAFTSIHIERYELEARKTKLGDEEITRDIPNVGDEALRNLDEDGIIRIGAEVGPGDILVGKITPRGETELTAEEKLLRAIFGEKAREVKDSSLYVPHGERGKVVDVRVFSRDNRDELPSGVLRKVQVSVAQKRKLAEGDKMAGRHGNKGVIAKIVPAADMPFLPDGTPVEIILNPIGVPSRMNVGQILETHLGAAAEALGLKIMSPVFDGAKEAEIQDALARAWLIGRAAQDADVSQASFKGTRESRHQRASRWLAARGFDAGRVFDDRFPGEAKRVALRVWLADNGEDSEVDEQQLEIVAEELARKHDLALPTSGKVQLRDGRTGELFDQPVTVGSIYMMKLAHLVEDKIHARSTGPYSLITQQPLGGKAQMGGQRFGEMEVWALEAYGAAHILQEILTVKSDDVVGRVKTYESIVKGEDILQPGVPESFKVLVKELQSLGLMVEVLNEEEKSIQFAEEAAAGDDGMSDLGIDFSRFAR